MRLLLVNWQDRDNPLAGGEHGNKGWDAAVAALEMTDLFERLDAADES